MRIEKPKSPRALIVEDENLVALMIAQMLAELGIEADHAARLDDALALAAQGIHDFALLDVNLRGISSLPVAASFQARGLPFILVTGDDRPLPPEYRAAPRLHKPFVPQQLRDMLAGIGHLPTAR